MLHIGTRRIAIFLTSLAFLFTTLVTGANAAMLGTDAAIQADSRAEHVSGIRSWLMQDQVRDQLVAMGVDPADAAERVAGMTAEEQRLLHDRIDELPAGATGLVEVIGVMFVVLLVLELVGITDVFSHL